MRLTHKIARVVELLESEFGSPPRPTPKSTLDCLIQTVLSQNTTDRVSHRVFHDLRRKFPRWEDARCAPLSALRGIIHPCGLFRQKAVTIRGILEHLPRKRPSLLFLKRGSSADAYSYLTSLKGVGSKTAKVVMLFSLGREVFPVDTHIARVTKRLALANESLTPDEISEQIEPWVPPGKCVSLHLNLIRFGRDVCVRRKPRCIGCPLHRFCAYVKSRPPKPDQVYVATKFVKPERRRAHLSGKTL